MGLDRHPAGRRGDGGRAVLLRRLEQRDLHGGRGPQPAAQPAALARAGRGHRLGALPGLQLRLPSVLPLEAIQHAPEDRVATAAASAILGPVAVQVMAAAIMVSTFGCLNGMILAGARVYYAWRWTGCSSSACASWTRCTTLPSLSLAVQCVWACLLTLTGRYSDLLDYVIFAVLLFYILTIAGLFVLRRTRPEMERPYRAFGYPVLPAALHRGRRADRDTAVALQAELHLAGADHRAAGRSGLLRLAAKERSSGMNLFATKPLEPHSGRVRGGEHTLKRTLGPGQPDRARHRRHHRRGAVLAHRHRRRRERRPGRGAVVRRWRPSAAPSPACATASSPP